MEEEPDFEAVPESESQSGEIADLLRHFGEEYGFGTDICDRVTSLPFPEAFETAHRHLTQAGLDPDEVLAKFMQEPED